MLCGHGAPIYQRQIVSGNLKMSAKKLPAWAEAAFLACGKEFFYLKERLESYLKKTTNDGFLIEIASKLPAVTGNGDSQVIADTEWQRIQFFQVVIWRADYFALPDSPKPFQNKFSAMIDLRTQKIEAKKILGYLEKIHRSLDLHHAASNRLGVRLLDCDPFQIIEDMDVRANEGEGYLRAIRDDFQMLMLRRGPIMQATKDLSDFMKALQHRLTTSKSEYLYGVWLGVDGHKRVSHFFASLEEWIARNSNTETDLLPEGFRLSDKSLADLGEAFFSKALVSQSTADYRSRRKKAQKKKFTGSNSED